MTNLPFDLGEFPYLVALHQEDNLYWQPAHVDPTGFGILPLLQHDSDKKGKNQSVFIEFAERAQPGSKVPIGVRGFTIGVDGGSVENRIDKREEKHPGTDSVRMVFGWPGLPVVQAYPTFQYSAFTSLSRGQLASLVDKLVTSYVSWALTQDMAQGMFPYIPWEYQEAPMVFLKRYVRVMSLVKLGDGSWTPVLGSRHLRILDGGKWDIPRCAQCEKGTCGLPSASSSSSSSSSY